MVWVADGHAGLRLKERDAAGQRGKSLSNRSATVIQAVGEQAWKDYNGRTP